MGLRVRDSFDRDYSGYSGYSDNSAYRVITIKRKEIWE